MLGANRIPLTVLVDAQGRVVAKHYGTADWSSDQALTYIRKALQLR